MDIKQEETIQKMLEETEYGDNKLRSLNEGFLGFYGRLEVIIKQHRRKMPVRDSRFQEEFRAAVLELRKLADRMLDFWKSARLYYYGTDKEKFVRENRINVKQIKTFAASFNRQCDELYTIYKNFSLSGKEIPLRLNWWLFESGCNDLVKISGSILFLLRDMEKHYE
jgi:hypothetical protein